MKKTVSDQPHRTDVSGQQKLKNKPLTSITRIFSFPSPPTTHRSYGEGIVLQGASFQMMLGMGARLARYICTGVPTHRENGFYFKKDHTSNGFVAVNENSTFFKI